MDKITKNNKGLVISDSDQSLFRLQSKFGKIPQLVMYYLTKFDDVTQCSFELLQTLHQLIYASQFMTSLIIPLSYNVLNLESVKRKRQNYKKFNILITERAF